MATDISRRADDGPAGSDPVLIHVWTLSLQGPRALPGPLALAAVDKVTNALPPFLTDLQAALSNTCRTLVVLHVED